MLEQRSSLESTRIPLVDLRRIHGPLRQEMLDAIEALVGRSELVNGPAVAAFEDAFARACGTGFCTGVASGLDAIRLSLQACGIEPGDEVIVPANAFVAALEAVVQLQAVPVLVDVTFDDYNIDPAAVEAALTSRTRFALPVHLYGQLADMASLTEITARRDVDVVEDACQAHGATRSGYRPGAGSHAAAFSFYPSKNLGALGDAGAIVTNDAAVADAARMLREHGERSKYDHQLVGWTARLDAIQAAVLQVKLSHLERWNEERREVARAYGERLEGVGDLVLPRVPSGSEPVWHLYVVRTADPSGLAAFLLDRGIQTGRHYPVPAHLSRAYESLGHCEGSFPVAETLARELLSLPIFPGMTESELDTVVSVVGDYFARG
jgi:dTDP-4-amino-4,6-dideoxygalactose transaminase